MKTCRFSRLNAVDGAEIQGIGRQAAQDSEQRRLA
jgi:hypothetical protein